MRHVEFDYFGGTMTEQDHPKRLKIDRTRILKIAAYLFFLIAITLTEYFIVLYAISLGVKDETMLQWTFSLPGTGTNITLAISPLFHLVPIAVIITLASSWQYLAKQLSNKQLDIQKGKPQIFLKKKEHGSGKERNTGSTAWKSKGFNRLTKREILTKVNIKSICLTLSVFLLMVFTISLLAYPHLIYETIANTYQNNQSFRNFMTNTGEAIASAGSVFSSINNAFLAASPVLRDFAVSLGVSIAPLAALDSSGKYLLFQNAAVWCLVFIILGYGTFRRQSQKHHGK